MGAVVYPNPPSVTGIEVTWPLVITGVPSFAPPGCTKVILGVNVYPEPELVILSALTSPLVTVAVIVAWEDPVLVGDCTCTTGGLVVL